MRTQPASQPPGQPSGQPPTSPIVITSWSRSVFQPALIIANALALISAPLFVLRRFDAERPWLILLIVCLLVALEGYATTIWLLQPERRLLNHGRYRAAEALVLLVLLRLVSWGVVGNWPTAQSWIELLSNPLLLFFDGFFAAALVAVYATWYRTLNMSNVFIRLAPDAAERHYYAIPRPERIEANQPMPINREALQNNFAQQFLGGAILVLFCTAILSIDLATIETIRNPLTEGIGRLRLPPGMLVGLLLYFLTSFLLFSQARLAMMEVRWLLEDVQKSPGIGRVWTRRTALILLVIGLGAAFLPVGSTFVFSQMLSWLIYGAMWVITAVFQILAFLILALLAYLFPNRTPAEPEPLEPMPPFQPQGLPELTEPVQSDLMQMILASAFWAVVIVMTVLAFSFFLRERNIKINSALFRQVWQVIVAGWRALWHRVKLQAKEVREVLQTRRQSALAPKSISPGWRFVRLNALSPREKVRYFYLSTVRRAGNEGVPRQESETPTEYAGDLKGAWPETGPEIDGLTEAFLHARYSRQPVTETDIPPIKAQWQRVKAAIRHRKKAANPATDEENV